MACIGNVPGKKNKIASCRLEIDKDGNLQLIAVLATHVGYSRYDIAYLYCKGEFNVKFPQKITLVKDHHNYWGFWTSDSESYEA